MAQGGLPRADLIGNQHIGASLEGQTQRVQEWLRDGAQGNQVGTPQPPRPMQAYDQRRAAEDEAVVHGSYAGNGQADLLHWVRFAQELAMRSAK